jgi:tetratricopeptide (TPR) repeat protein
VILRSGTEERVTMSSTAFVRSWAPGNNWALLVLAPSQRPATAREKPFLSAVVGLERSKQFGAATTGYQTALAQWPDSLGAMIGLGNSYYAAGNLAAAAAAFRKATLVHQDSAAAFNNLAHVLAKQGRRREALSAAQKAVALGGPLAAVSRTTLAEISRVLPAKKARENAPLRPEHP